MELTSFSTFHSRISTPSRMAGSWKKEFWLLFILGGFSLFASIALIVWLVAEVVNWRISTSWEPLDFLILHIRAEIFFGCVAISTIALLIWQWDERRTRAFIWENYGKHWTIPRNSVNIIERKTEVAGQKFGNELSGQERPKNINLQKRDNEEELGALSTEIMIAKRRQFEQYAVINDSDRADFIKFRQTSYLEMSNDDLIYFYELREMRHYTLASFMGMAYNEKEEKKNQREATVPQLMVLHGMILRGTLEDMCFDGKYHFNNMFKSAFMQNILTGLEYLHRSKIGYHGFLQASNCLIGIDWVVKLSLFGITNYISDLLDSGKIVEEEINPQVPIKYFARFPPEHLKEYDPTGKKPPRMIRGSQKGDVYCAGMIFSMLIQRKDPFHLDNLTEKFRRDDIIGMIIRDVDPLVPFVSEESWKEEARIDICLKCWRRNPEDRPDVGELLEAVRTVYPGTKRTLSDMLVRMHSQKIDELEDIVKDRTYELELEKEKCQRLLYQMMPPSIARAVENKEHVPAKYYESATVLFFYVADFQEVVRKTTCDQLIQFLNDVFNEIDKVADRHDVYKVETIGESYMVASGLPVENGGNHVYEVDNMSLEIKDSLAHFQFPVIENYKLRIRIGFQSGAVAAGVIGYKAPRYCLFGDTVNVASRMQLNCPPNKIMTSKKTAEKLEGESAYHLMKHGIIYVKGKGDVTCYLLNRRRYRTLTEGTSGIQ